MNTPRAVVAAVDLIGCLAAWSATAVAQSLPKASGLPDWSGAWTRATGQFYESTAEQALEPPPAADSPRRKPPYTPKFEQR